MGTSELIEQCLAAIEAEDRAKLKEIGKQLTGRRVSASVDWHGKRTTMTSGEVVAVDENDVYLDTALGTVAGDVQTMQAED